MRLEVGRGCYHDVIGNPDTGDNTIEVLSGLASMGAIRHDDEYIQITVRTHLPSCRGTEEDDLQRVYSIYYASDQLIQLFGNLRVHGISV